MNHRRNKIRKHDFQKRNLERAILMAKEGNLGIAIQSSIKRNGRKNENTLDHSIEKLLSGKVVTSEQPLPKNTALKTSTERVLKEIASLAAGSSPGL